MGILGGIEGAAYPTSTKSTIANGVFKAGLILGLSEAAVQFLGAKRLTALLASGAGVITIENALRPYLAGRRVKTLNDQLATAQEAASQANITKTAADTEFARIRVALVGLLSEQPEEGEPLTTLEAVQQLTTEIRQTEAELNRLETEVRRFENLLPPAREGEQRPSTEVVRALGQGLRVKTAKLEEVHGKLLGLLPPKSPQRQKPPTIEQIVGALPDRLQTLVTARAEYHGQFQTLIEVSGVQVPKGSTVAEVGQLLERKIQELRQQGTTSPTTQLPQATGGDPSTSAKLITPIEPPVTQPKRQTPPSSPPPTDPTLIHSTSPIRPSRGSISSSETSTGGSKPKVKGRKRGRRRGKRNKGNGSGAKRQVDFGSTGNGGGQTSISATTTQKEDNGAGVGNGNGKGKAAPVPVVTGATNAEKETEK